MSSPTNTPRKNSTKTVSEEKHEDRLQDKRRLLSYWKSLGSPTSSEENDGTENGKDPLLEELKKSVTDMDLCLSEIIVAEKETNDLRDEGLSLIKQLGQCMQHLVIKEKNKLDLNDNSKIDNGIDTLKTERDSLEEKNEHLAKELEKVNTKYKLTTKEQQQDIEKLTREVQTSYNSRRKLERELCQAVELKDENETTINSLREEIETIKGNYENDIEKLGSVNEQFSKDNNELVEKGKEATEKLKVALQQLTNEKNALLEEKKSGKEIKALETCLERAKKERETFRLRCEKSEMVQRNLQQEISSLNDLLKEQKDEIKSQSKDDREKEESKTVDGELTESKLKSAQSQLSQVKSYVHVLESQLKEREETIFALRKENAKANDVAMEKSLELSRNRRIMERKIEKLVKENSELKRKFLIPPNYGKITGISEQSSTTQPNSEQTPAEVKGKQRQRRYDKNRRKSDPEKSAVENSLKNVNNVVSQNVIEQKQQKPDINLSEEPTNNKQSAVVSSFETRSIDVAPKRRIGGKFIRATSNRHSADLGKLMSRHLPESTTAKKSESDTPNDGGSSTIFVNKYRKGSEEHWV